MIIGKNSAHLAVAGNPRVSVQLKSGTRVSENSKYSIFSCWFLS